MSRLKGAGGQVSAASLRAISSNEQTTKNAQYLTKLEGGHRNTAN
jgi:hypothetical protein